MAGRLHSDDWQIVASPHQSFLNRLRAFERLLAQPASTRRKRSFLEHCRFIAQTEVRKLRDENRAVTSVDLELVVQEALLQLFENAPRIESPELEMRRIVHSRLRGGARMQALEQGLARLNNSLDGLIDSIRESARDYAAAQQRLEGEWLDSPT